MTAASEASIASVCDGRSKPFTKSTACMFKEIAMHDLGPSDLELHGSKPTEKSPTLPDRRDQTRGGGP